MNHLKKFKSFLIRESNQDESKDYLIKRIMQLSSYKESDLENKSDLELYQQLQEIVSGKHRDYVDREQIIDYILKYSSYKRENLENKSDIMLYKMMIYYQEGY